MQNSFSGLHEEVKGLHEKLQTQIAGFKQDSTILVENVQERVDDSLSEINQQISKTVSDSIESLKVNLKEEIGQQVHEILPTVESITRENVVSLT